LDHIKLCFEICLAFLLGTYGTVFKAKNRETHEIVALKRVRLDDDDEVSTCKVIYEMYWHFILFHRINFPKNCSWMECIYG
jgi:serine/threonine protein kinase